MSRIQSICALGLLGCLAVTAGCSTPQPKPDATVKQVAKPAADASKAPAQHEPSAELTKPSTAESLPPAEESKSDEATSGERAGDPTAMSSGFKSDLASALDAAHSGDRDTAIKRMQPLVDDPHGGFLAAFNLGVLYEDKADYRNAASRYAQALGKNPDFSPALRNLVRLYLRLGQSLDADKIARKYVDTRPDNMTHRAVALEIDLRQGKYEEVIRKAKQVLHHDEKNVEAMMIMAEANIQLGRLELAEAILDRAHELRPHRAEILFKYAKIRMQQERNNDAIAFLQETIKLRPGYPEAHNNLGVLYHHAGDDPAAVTEFNAAIDDYPDFKAAYLNLGNSLKALGKFTKAEASFKKALAIDATYGDALFNLGVLYLDSDLEGIDTVAQLHTAIDYFTKYKNVMGSRLPKDDPADKYLAEARKSIDVETQRQKMLRQAQMQSEPTDAPPADDASNGAPEAKGDDGQQ